MPDLDFVAWLKMTRADCLREEEQAAPDSFRLGWYAGYRAAAEAIAFRFRELLVPVPKADPKGGRTGP